MATLHCRLLMLPQGPAPPHSTPHCGAANPQPPCFSSYLHVPPAQSRMPLTPSICLLLPDILDLDAPSAHLRREDEDLRVAPPERHERGGERGRVVLLLADTWICAHLVQIVSDVLHYLELELALPACQLVVKEQTAYIWPTMRSRSSRSCPASTRIRAQRAARNF